MAIPNALLDAPKDLSWRERLKICNRFDRKVADYVVCDRNTFDVVAIVELDDKTQHHERCCVGLLPNRILNL